MKKSDWISVKDRLPKPETDVIIYHGRVSIGRMSHHSVWFAEQEAWAVEVTHWMPLPEKPD